MFKLYPVCVNYSSKVKLPVYITTSADRLRLREEGISWCNVCRDYLLRIQTTNSPYFSVEVGLQ